MGQDALEIRLQAIGELDQGRDATLHSALVPALPESLGVATVAVAPEPLQVLFE